MASVGLLEEVGQRPILVLDDVFAELDAERRMRLADLAQGFEQVIVTAAVDADVPLTGRRIDVRLDGACSRLSERDGRQER
jgi:DNA replication and repair protein RecF